MVETMIAIISKLPKDLYDVQHILPFWFTYLYWFLWFAGITLVFILLIYLGAKFVHYLQGLPTDEDAKFKLEQDRRFSKIELRRDLKVIFDNSIKNQAYRSGLHRMSAIIKTYFEILLKKDIEEMTAREIRINVEENKELGEFFTSLTVAQYKISEPEKEEFIQYYESALELIN